MASSYLINKYYSSFKGLDVRSNDLVRPSSYASEILNASYTKTGAIVKRNGSQIKATNVGGGGLTTWQDVNLTTGDIKEKLITIDNSLHVLKDGYISITYSGSLIAYCIFYLNKTNNEFYFDLYEDSALVGSFPLGTGVDEISPITISDLTTSINSITDFSATAIGDTAVPAAYLDIQEG